MLTEVKKMKLMTERVIIIGGGFAGLELAKKLSDNKHSEVIVVDRNNFHFFPTLLYQVSTAFIEPKIHGWSKSRFCCHWRSIVKTGD